LVYLAKYEDLQNEVLAIKSFRAFEQMPFCWEKKLARATHWWLKPVILATGEDGSFSPAWAYSSRYPIS
jgi:hypothetical protein